MKIETTLNIKKEVFSEIHKVSGLTGISKSFIIVQLFRIIQKDFNDFAFRPRTIQYQSSVQKEYKVFHISFTQHEYEQFLNLRIFYKQSLSRLLALAVELYLEKLLKDLLKNPLILSGIKFTDNYHIELSLEKTGAIKWTIFWGLPNRIMKKLKTKSTNY